MTSLHYLSADSRPAILAVLARWDQRGRAPGQSVLAEPSLSLPYPQAYKPLDADSDIRLMLAFRFGHLLCSRGRAQ